MGKLLRSNDGLLPAWTVTQDEAARNPAISNDADGEPIILEVKLMVCIFLPKISRFIVQSFLDLTRKSFGYSTIIRLFDRSLKRDSGGGSRWFCP